MDRICTKSMNIAVEDLKINPMEPSIQQFLSWI